ncbi:protein kinase [Streptomyces sp. Go40/10]|uniref:serine/threonine protein kinase n=1 Tax=Streptomyces sp. Go40/10 TaxID=2825844 RepID=UPI001E52A5EC|nr:protein kinase [Streptomyces sp. Go40/10]UFR01254.1 protein kinase [Streptomyces sp. Go40/10]
MTTTPPTRFVDPADGGFTNARIIETRPVRADVPPALADRFLLVAVLSEALRPAEAVVLRVRDLTARHGAAEIPLVLKWYHRLHAPDPDVEQELRELGARPAPHLERLLETGDAHGHPWHLYWSHGEETLERYLQDHPDGLPPDAVHAVVGQLWDAVTALHERGVVHRDITPDNIMVQTRRGDTADLVLVDFGAAVHRPEEALEPRTDWRGKPLYLAPEAGLLRQTVSEAGDWWSLGMVTAHLALGRHPIEFRRDEDVLAEIATHDPDVSGITHRRTRLLCEGLLTRAPEQRWQAEQVRDWLDGKDPDVAPRTDGRIFPDDPARPAVRPFPFMGQEFTGTEHLAVHLDQNHVSAARMLADDEDRARLVEWLGQFASVGGRSSGELDRLRRLRQDLAGPPPVAVVVDLLNWLGPGLDVTWHGAPLDAQGMRRLCQSARDGHADAVTLVRYLADHPEVLTGLAQRPGGHGLDRTADAWRVLRDRWEPTVHELRRDRRDRADLRRTVAVDAWLLQLAREPERTREQLTRLLLRIRAELPARIPWFDALLSAQDDDVRLVVALLLTGRARRDAQALSDRRLEEEHARLLAADQDGLIAVLRRMDRLPTVGWALLGAVAVTAPWTFVIGLADVLGRASDEAVVTAWLEALPAAAFVFVVEMWTAVYIGPPFYHPGRSLAGLLIRSSERPGRLARTRLGRWVGAALLVLAGFAGFYAVAVAPWLWPLASAAAVAVWSVRRGWAWRRLRSERRARREARRRGRQWRPGPDGQPGARLPLRDRWRRLLRTVRGRAGDGWRRLRQAVRGRAGGRSRWPGRPAGDRAGAGGRWRRGRQPDTGRTGGWWRRPGQRVRARAGNGWRRLRRVVRRRAGTTTDTTGEQT